MGPTASGTEVPNRVAGLDLLRGLAALGVVLFHLMRAAHLSDPAVPLFAPGALGVDIFFCLSGCVILMTAYRSRDRGAFALARLIRLYPAFVICVGLTTAWVLGLRLSTWELSPADWLLNLTMVPQWFGAPLVEGAYWTLRYEIGFYAIVAALLPAVKRGYALHFAAVFLLALPLLPHGSVNASFFVMGIALYEMRHNRLFAVVVLTAAIIIGHHLDMTLLAPLSVGIAALVPAPRRFAAWAGAVSYPLYLLHDHIGCMLVLMYASILDGWSGLVLAVGGVVLLAAAVHYFLERPAARYLKSALKRPGGAGRRTPFDAAPPAGASAPRQVSPG